ncbi:hypothetical protein BXY85_3474 [Roseivirga pacifica]|uniref:Uncharacterized protein n=1 Tax=Roseivirga pacifica TaxID=1267423 RepID=A0A1I0QJM0_9BACT|nr:hypothetical protein [Roseivirga pacifica]RKQ42857.1 hypothetical protein BXY85_3474 [Roseivirga pacifica]SEW27341.1 hypothetical protein SAMN05216290_2401 [Roseivirga pacifica]
MEASKQLNAGRIVAALFMMIALLLIVNFFRTTTIQVDFATYFTPAYYMQFSLLLMPMALLNAGFLLIRGSKQANLALAIFGYMAILELFFDLVGVTPSFTPVFVVIVLLLAAGSAIYIAHTNTFSTNKLSKTGLIVSLLIGVVESLIPLFI